VRFFVACTIVLITACQTAPAPGAHCERDSECSGGLVCRFARCRVGCAAQRDCPTPQLCLRDAMGVASCGLSDDPMCDGSPGSCTGGLSCIDHFCVNACHAIADCPEGSQCVTVGMLARCVRADVDAGPPDDAGAPCHGPRCDPVGFVVADNAGACVNTETNAVWCWGNGRFLGNGGVAQTCTVSDCSSVPVQVQGDQLGMHDPLADVRSLSVGNGVACGVDLGRIVCWGQSFGDTLGTTIPDGIYARPVLLESGGTMPTDFTSVTVGEDTAIALRPGAAYGWGLNDNGELAGAAGMDVLAIPAPAIPSDGVVRIGADHACALVGGVVSCWGANGDGEAGGSNLGLGERVDSPTPVPGLPTIQMTAILVGRDHACALTQDGNIWCWGNRNVAGVRIDPPGCAMGVSRLACPPTQVARAGMTYRAFAEGSFTNAACALDTDGGVWCWGENDRGVFPTNGAGEPVQVPGLPPIESMALSDRFACAVDYDHDVWCWGDNDQGQLGRGTDDEMAHPIPARVVFPR
jgi:hypothetical protein